VSAIVSELVAGRRHILIGFDGPVCAPFAAYGAADVSRQLAMLMSMDGVPVPAGLSDGDDPFDLLRFAAATGDPDLLAETDAELRRLELQAVRIAAPTAGAPDVMRALVEAGHTLTVVAGIGDAAVRFFLSARRLAGLVTGVSARRDADPSLLAPNPHLLLEALAALGASPDDAVLVAGASADVAAAHAAGMPVIGFRDRPDGRRLHDARPDALVERLTLLLHGGSDPGRK
jgi:beta-phosphoglucomutase-like phosphatase (HAD superfamily)